MSLDPDHYGSLSILEVASDILDGFVCGKPGLDTFLSDGAHTFHQGRIGFTRVVFHSEWKGPVGYFTLANDAIPLTQSENDALGLVDHVGISAFPAVKIGRLAVHQDLHRQGVGSAIMRLILGEVLDLDSLSAARLLVIDADNDDAVLAFYRKHGFVDSLWAIDQRQKLGRRAGRSATIKMHRDVLEGL